MKLVVESSALYQSRMQFHFVSKLNFLSHQVWFLGNKSMGSFCNEFAFYMDMLECKRGNLLENFK